MPEPAASVATAAVTLASAAVSIPVLTILGVPLGLRADLLIAGFAGGIAAIGLLNSVPGTDDTWREMLRLGLRRVFVVVCSALTAGYITPLALLIANVPHSLMLSCAFGVGGGAQHVLAFVIRRLSGQEPPLAPAPPVPPAAPGGGTP